MHASKPRQVLHGHLSSPLSQPVKGATFNIVDRTCRLVLLVVLCDLGIGGAIDRRVPVAGHGRRRSGRAAGHLCRG